MGGTNKTPSQTQTFQTMPQSQAITTAQNFPGPYDIANDPFNYTGFTQYNNEQPVTGYDWWAPGNPSVTQNLPGGGSLTTNPAGSGEPRQVTPQRTNADLASGYQRFTGFGTPAGTPPPTGTPPPAGTPTSFGAGSSTVPMSEQLRRQAYMQMMGGGNYGGVIPQQPNSPGTPPPGTPPPGTPPPVTPQGGTRYGTWQGNDTTGAAGTYRPFLPWGLTAQTEGGGNGFMDIGYGPGHDPTGLQWDINTGHIVGGDQQADAFQSQWNQTPLSRGMTHNRNGNPLPTAQTPFWWESAQDPNFTHSSFQTYAPDSGYTWNLGAPIPDNMQSPVNSYNPVNYFGTQPPPAAPESSNALSSVPNGLSNVPAGGVGTGLSGGFGDPWTGLNGMNQAMTNASSYGSSPWKRGRRG